MHEIHLIKDLLSDLLAHAKEHKVSKITKVIIRLGEFTEINPEILKHHFAEHAKDTLVAGAELTLETGALRELRLVSYDGE
ncbi:MAG: hydrogenase maturation nickel metallochaperone HypA [Candidatus Margulisiibacteriota bacterium]|jgi:hydrogenase nickel incorporation protein HypA/HybF